MLQLLFAQFVILYVEKCQEVRSAAEWELIAPSHEDSKSQLQGPIIYQPGTTRHRLVSFQTVHYMTCPRWLPSRQTWWFLRFLTVTGFCTPIQSIVLFVLFCFFPSHFNTITPLCTDAESCQCSCSISTYELCRWHSHSYLFSKCHGYSLPRTVAQLLNLCHNEVVNTTIKPHEYSHQNNSTKVPRDQEANWKHIYTVVCLDDGSEQCFTI